MSYFLCCFDEFMSSNFLIRAPSFAHDMQESCICQRRRSSCIGRLLKENTSSMFATQNLSRGSVGFSMISLLVPLSEFRMDVSIREKRKWEAELTVSYLVKRCQKFCWVLLRHLTAWLCVLLSEYSGVRFGVAQVEEWNCITLEAPLG